MTLYDRSARARFATFAVMVFVGASAPPSHAQDLSVTNPCTAPEVAAEIDQFTSNYPIELLYDGLAPLKQAPSVQVKIPAGVAANPFVCLVFGVSFVEADGALAAQNINFQAAFGPGLTAFDRPRHAPAYQQAARELTRDMLAHDVLPVRPRPGQRYAIAIPIWNPHPLYSMPAVRVADGGGGSSSPAPPTLVDRGFANSTLAEQGDGFVVYRLGEMGQQLWFAVVRSVGRTDEILDYTGEYDDQAGQTIYRYGPETERRFREHILPHVSPNFAGGSIQVWHYAEGTRLRTQPELGWEYSNPMPPSGRLGEAENPISIEFWRAQRSLTGGSLEWFGGVGTSFNPIMTRSAWNTIAQIDSAQAVYAGLEDQGQRDRTDRIARDAVEFEARLAQLASQEDEKRRAYARAGLVYRDQAYWDAFVQGPEIRAVFEGSFPDPTRTWEFGQMYERTATAFAARCDSLIPHPSPERRRLRTATEPDGRTSTSVDQVTRIRKAFFAPFEWEDENDPRALVVLPRTGLASMGGQYLGFQRGLREDFAILYQGGCRNPVLRQFEENLRRLAHRLPSLQAEQAPETLPDPRHESDIAGKCATYIDEYGLEVGREWCPCLARVFGERMTIGQVWNELFDYRTFFRRIDTPPTGGPSDPGWRYYEPANECRG